MDPATASCDEWLSPDLNGKIGRRNAARLRLSIPAKLVTVCDTRRCILVDLSRTGARVGLEVPLRKGDAAIVQLSGAEHFGLITRSDTGPYGGANGVEFEAPLSNEDVLAVRSFAESFREEEHKALRREVQAWVTGVR